MSLMPPPDSLFFKRGVWRDLARGRKGDGSILKKVKLKNWGQALTEDNLLGAKGVALNLPQFDGHFEKEYTINLKGVSNEKEAGIFTGV